MTQKDKELLLMDLSARLPYMVKGLHRGEKREILAMDSFGSYQVNEYDAWFDLNSVIFKPYLFPLSSMTEEQTKELINLINTGQNDNNEFMRTLCRIEFYHKHHFDYRGLIKKGLALDVTGLNIY